MASSYRIENRSNRWIQVVMDTEREIHEVGPLGTQVFTRANPFDRPTFRAYAYENGQRREFLDSKKAGYWSALWASGHYRFNGSKFD